MQILEEMEAEFGILCPAGLPKDQYQEDMLSMDKQSSALKSTLQSHQEELGKAQSSFSQVEEEKNKVGVTSRQEYSKTNENNLQMH